ncbi:MAG: LD-carboxypeptidase [Chitinophagaceae bacterium]|nr:LD-carboxypeptidase [Chitinophagaceae bacterium]
MKTILPAYLKPGDTIGLVAAAGYMPDEKFARCIEVLKARGYKVLKGKTPGHQFHYFSGTDKQRLTDLQKMMDNDKVKAILSVRGGYGSVRIVDDLDFKKFVRNPKWIIGFSDITVFLNHIYTKYNIGSLHAPMAAAFNEGDDINEYVQSLLDALEGKKAVYHSEAHKFDHKGKCSGTLVGGNLMLLVNLIGTPSVPDMKNKILFIEDTGEYIYSIDRMMYHLKRSGNLKKLKGVVVGRFSEMKDTDHPFGQTVEEVIRDVLKEYKYPVCFNFPVGHQTENYALKVGATYSLEVGNTGTVLREV